MIRSYWFIRDMPKNYEYVNNMEKRLRLKSADPEERVVTHLRTPRDLEAMPFPLNGRATGFEGGNVVLGKQPLKEDFRFIIVYRDEGHRKRRLRTEV